MRRRVLRRQASVGTSQQTRGSRLAHLGRGIIFGFQQRGVRWAHDLVVGTSFGTRARFVSVWMPHICWSRFVFVRRSELAGVQPHSHPLLYFVCVGQQGLHRTQELVVGGVREHV
eukprot:3064795-Prymnesium_polylepis.1